MMVKEALLVLATLSQIIAAKMDKPISHAIGWVNVQIAIAAVRSYYRLLRRYRPPSPFMKQEPEWVLVSGLGLVQ